MAKKIKPLATPNLQQPLTGKLLGECIRAKRTQNNLRLEDAALLCQVAKQTLMKIEQGRETNRLDTLLHVCQQFGIKLYIHSESNDDEPNHE